MVNKNKAVLVEKNGQQLKYKLHDHRKNAVNDLEHAAALEENSDETTPVITGIHKSKKSKKKKNKSNVKLIFSAITSAAIIGSLLGFFMIRMFVNVEPYSTGQAINNSIPVSGTNENTETSAVSPIELAPLKAHVIQAGIFSERANAEEAAADYEAKGIPVMIWDRDDQFFLLAGITQTNEQAKGIAEEMKQTHSVDIYVKEWSSISGTPELTTAEQEWLVEFQSVWQNSLTSWSEQNTFSGEEWTKLITGKPEKSETLAAFETANSTEQASAVQLLNWMYAYEQVIQ